MYAGVMGGSHYNQAGGGTTRLCMPLDPEYTLPYTSGVQNYSPLYQVEYQSTIRINLSVRRQGAWWQNVVKRA